MTGLIGVFHGWRFKIIFFYVQLVNDIINKIFVSFVSTAHSLGNLRLLDKEVISLSTNYGISMFKRGTETWYT